MLYGHVMGLTPLSERDVILEQSNLALEQFDFGSPAAREAFAALLLAYRKLSANGGTEAGGGVAHELELLRQGQEQLI